MLTTVEFPGENAGAADLPGHPEGKPWAYAMGHDGEMVSFADTTGELISVLIDGYADLGDTDTDHDTALRLRYNHLLMLAAHYQAESNAAATAAGLLDDADENTLTALYADRTEPYEGAEWHGPRLILIATDYAPFTELPQPTGQCVLLLDPFRETTYLRSLHTLEFIAFAVHSGVPALV